MTSVFFTLPITKFYLIYCIHFIHFVLVPCVYLLNGGGQGTASWCRESVRVGSSQVQQCSMFYDTPCVQHSWAVMFSVTQEELSPMAMDETLGPELISFSLLFIIELDVNKNRSTFYFLLSMQGESNSALCFACPMFFIKDNWR